MWHVWNNKPLTSPLLHESTLLNHWSTLLSEIIQAYSQSLKKWTQQIWAKLSRIGDVLQVAKTYNAKNKEKINSKKKLNEQIQGHPQGNPAAPILGTSEHIFVAKTYNI